MKFKRTHYSPEDEGYILRLDPGDEIVETIQGFCVDQGIKNGDLWGIGSVENPTLAHYRLDRKKYSEKTLEGIFEITMLFGNIALFEGQPLPHIHVTLSDEQMRAFGGHLVEGTCSATVELGLDTYSDAYTKSFNDKIGLKLWDF